MPPLCQICTRLGIGLAPGKTWEACRDLCFRRTGSPCVLVDLQKPQAQGIDHGFEPGGRAKLAAKVAYVIADRMRADVKLLGYI